MALDSRLRGNDRIENSGKMLNCVSPIEEKLRKELRSGTRVVSNAFTFPTGEPVGKEHRVYLYEK